VIFLSPFLPIPRQNTKPRYKSHLPQITCPAERVRGETSKTKCYIHAIMILSKHEICSFLLHLKHGNSKEMSLIILNSTYQSSRLLYLTLY
jgi:hypothetical protein